MIVDTPATGHSLEYLDMLWTADWTLRGGLVQRETERVTLLLSDPQQTAGHLVTSPDDLPVSEPLKAYDRLLADRTFPLGWLFINRVHTAPMSRVRLGRARIAKRVTPQARLLAERMLAWADTEA